MPDSVLYGLVGLVFFQAYVTVRVVRHRSYTSERKRNQLLIIWLVPFVGAALALGGLSTDEESAARPEKDK